MRVCSVTLAGPGTEGIIGDALRSVVDEVDNCLIIFTEADGGYILNEIDSVAKDKAIMTVEPWRDGFGEMRNIALDAAKPWDLDWAIWLDTDERIQFQPDWREALNTPACAVRAWHVSGEYSKERFIRLPRQGSYVGPVHEYFAPKKGRTIDDTRLVTFDELPRDTESPAWIAKLERDHRVLREYTRTNKDARWLFYLGDTCALLGDNRAALRAWEKATWAYGDDEIRAWAAFKAANVCLTEGKHESALHLVARGITVYPFAPELFWVAAAAAFDAERYEAAIEYAMHAGVAGNYNGWGRLRQRSGFVYPPALWEGPHDIMSLAYERLGRPDLALKAREEFVKAKAKREAQ